jgi:hypothetical protein
VRDVLAEGLIVAARIADHIEPHHNDPVKFWTGALQSLCARTATRAERSSRSIAGSTIRSAPPAGLIPPPAPVFSVWRGGGHPQARTAMKTAATIFALALVAPIVSDKCHKLSFYFLHI